MNKKLIVISVIVICLLIGGTILLYNSLPQATNPPAANTISPTPAKTVAAPVKKFEKSKKLQAESDALLPLFDKMPFVPVYLSDELIEKEGSNIEKGVAYTTCESSQSPEIMMKKSFFQKANHKQLINILKHELTHAWLCRQNKMSVGHGEPFQKKFKQVGGFGN